MAPLEFVLMTTNNRAPYYLDNVPWLITGIVLFGMIVLLAEVWVVLQIAETWLLAFSTN